jgi:hypothetical protein
LSIDVSDPSLSQKKFKRLLRSIQSKYVHSLKFPAAKWISRISIKYFSFLHSLTFINTQNSTKIQKFLEKLPSPNQLYHLSIDFKWYENGMQDLTATIFKLPNLNRLEFYVHGNPPLNFVKLDQPLLSLRHFSISFYEWNFFLKLVAFMPNLISLDLSSERYMRYSSLIFIEPMNLSKLKTLRMNNVEGYDQINYIFQLFPQIEIFKVQCHSKSDIDSMIKADNWEKLFMAMKFLKKIEISIRGVHEIDLSEYDTDFWTQRNLKAIEYKGQKPIQRFFCIK